MSSPAARERWRNKRTAMVEHFCRANNFKLERLNQGYQLRIEDSFDFYPTNGKWHFLPTGERGDWHTELDLKLVILEMLKPELGVAREPLVYIDEASNISEQDYRKLKRIMHPHWLKRLYRWLRRRK